MAFSADKLGKSAARLQPVEFSPCPMEVGRNTGSAMQIGAYHVGLNGVVGTIGALMDRYGDRPLFVTGGLAHLLAGGGRALQPDFTLWGAAYLGSRVLGVSKVS
jgi:pantothenate kinase type III